jgi:hypothetical protein
MYEPGDSGGTWKNTVIAPLELDDVIPTSERLGEALVPK